MTVMLKSSSLLTFAWKLISSLATSPRRIQGKRETSNHKLIHINTIKKNIDVFVKKESNADQVNNNIAITSVLNSFLIV